MPPTRVLALAAAASAAVLTFSSPASATTVSPAGFFEASLLGNATFTTAVVSTPCGTSTLQGSVAAGGSLSFANGIYGLCAGAVVIPVFPWSGGSIVYAPAGGYDGTVTIAGFRYQHLIPLGGTTVSCTYGGTLTGTVYNGTNSSRPYPVPELQIVISNATANKTGGSFLCPSTSTVSFTYQLKGLTLATGAYNLTLALAP